MEHIHVNVQMSESEKKRVLRQESFWSAPKLILVGVVVLGLAISGLIYVAHLPALYQG